ncbi:hypothetical protein ABPG74_019529 [Tetrahymena malaccensis]
MSEKLKTIPEGISPSSSRYLNTSDQFSPLFDRQVIRDSQILGERIMDANIPQFCQNQSPIHSQSYSRSQYQQQLTLQDLKQSRVHQNAQTNLFQVKNFENNQYEKENEILKQKINEIKEIQQRKRTCSTIQEQKQNENILDQYKQLAVNYNNAQNKILELEKSCKTKSETLNKQKEQITMMSRVLQSNMENLGLEKFIQEVNQESKVNNVELFTEFANIKILVDSQKVENQELELRMEQQVGLINQMRDEIAHLKIQNQESVEFSEKLNNELKTAVDALHLVQDENAKVSQDKEALLEYLEELKTTYDNVARDKEDLQNTVLKLEEKISQFKESNSKDIDLLKQTIKDQQQSIQDFEREKKAKELQDKHQTQLLNNEIDTLKREKERIQTELNTLFGEKKQLQQNHDQLQQKLDKEKKSSETLIEKLQTREQNLLTSVKNLEEVILKLNKEKDINGQIIGKIKDFVSNKEVIALIEEIANICSEQISIEREKNSINVQIFSIESKMGNKSSAQSVDPETQKSNRRKLEELRDARNQYENNQQILQCKHKALENELAQLLELERNKNMRIQQLEKINNHLKNDLSVLKNEIDMKEITRKNIESAYNILLTDYKRLTQEQKAPGRVKDYLAQSNNGSMSTTMLTRRNNYQSNINGTCSPSESFRKNNSVQIPYNIYENLDDHSMILNQSQQQGFGSRGSAKSSMIGNMNYNSYNPSNSTANLANNIKNNDY